MILSIKRLRDNAILPRRATLQSAGCDLCACLEEGVEIPVGETRVIPTGVAIEPPKDTVVLVFGRSGLGIKQGIAPANAVGVIDEDYRGEILVGLHNHSKTPYAVAHGERIAQLVVIPVIYPEIVETLTLSDTLRGEGGLGSTGRG